MRSRRTSPAGFTIVELLIVVVVIAILAAVVIVAYSGVQNRAKVSAVQSAVEQAAKKVQLFAVDNSDSYPTSLAAVGINDTSTTAYQYSVNNTASPRTFCVSATISGVNYYVSQAVSTPTAGTCGVSYASVFGASYPYPINYYNDGGGSLKLATLFYSNSSSFTIKGGRVYLPSVPAGQSLTIFYVSGWYGSLSSTIHQPDWSNVPSSIPGQYATIPSGSVTTGWNEVTFPTSATINKYTNGVDGTAVWVGYYFSDGASYVHSPSPTDAAIQSVSNPHLYLAERVFEGQGRSNHSLYSGTWMGDLYGIDILTVGP